MLFHLLALLAPPIAHADSFDVQARAACAAPIGARPRLPGIEIEAIDASDGDLPYLRITDRRSGGWMKAHYDAVSARSAWARAACLGAQLRLIGDETEEAWPSGQWFSVTFTADPAYVPPRDARDRRWTVVTRPDGTLGAEGENMAVVTMPHEQVHAFQKRAGAQLPRWLEEGHAEWISRKITARLAPAAGQVDARRHADALAASTTPVELSKWGGVSVTRDAILRQASAEDRKKMEADPAFVPPGPYKISSGDLTSDESNIQARYEAAWRVFENLERAHGASKVQSWVRDLTATGGRVTPERIEDTGRLRLRENLNLRLQ
ncbi:MAG: hypothetical protein MT490_16715 [Sphingomonas sp.]|uniref:hypothetical protein n=1 Tax=Sphingomonas sp. TaxID=28214 RepID=UPI00227362E3|nr:hypothetical protein [Sphingomonas sp.]MCX8477433.1 hypothetical protein [Sphingomonas sp.]